MHQNQWVVRSSGRILGPFSTDEMVRRLESRNISLIDEVAAPFSRWGYVREQPQFSAVVERLQKDSYNGKEDTKTATISGQTQTMTMTMTEAGLDASREETNSGVKSIITSTASQPAKARPVKSYGDTAVVDGTSWSGALWIVSGLLIVGLAGYIYFFKNSSHSTSGLGSNWLQLGQLAMELGQYGQAIEHYANAYSQTQDTETALNYAALLIANNETVQAKRVLDSLETLSVSTRRKANILKGLAFLTDQDVGKAISFFERDVRSPKGIFVPAAFNLGIANSMIGKYTEADNAFKMSVSRVGADEDTLQFANAVDGYFYQAYNLALQIKRIKKPKKVREVAERAKKAVVQSIASNGRYRNESYLLQAWIELKLGAKKTATLRLNQFLDSYPGMSADHVPSVYIFDHYVNWKALGAFCNDLINSLPESGRTMAAQAACEYKKGNYQYKKFIADAVSMSKKDGLVRSMESYLLLETGETRRAETVLEMATDDGKNYFLPYLLRGESCWAKSDHRCAYKNWLVALNRNPNDIAAIVGLAKYFYALGGKSAKDGLLVTSEKTGLQMAQEYVRHGMKISNNYKPLLLLKHEMEKF